MKKILSIAFISLAMLLVGNISAEAQTWRNQGNVRTNQVVRTYTQTKTVWINGRQYRETYRVRVFRNGRTSSSLISRVALKNNRGNNSRGVQTYYQTRTVWQNGRRYRVTYKITKFRNGRTQSQIVSRTRV